MTSLTGMLTGQLAVARPEVVVVRARARAHTSPPPPGISQRMVLITLLVGTLVAITLVLHSPGGVL